MDKQQKTYPILIVAAVGIIAFILFLLFVPDMSTTLMNTVPEYPPETVIVDTNEVLITNAVTIDKTNVKSIISAMARPGEYFLKTESTLSHTDGRATYERTRWEKGVLSRVDVTSPFQSSATHYVYTKDYVYVWREGSRTYHKAARGDFEPDDAQMMMTYEDILNTDDEEILTASLASYNDSVCIYAEVKSSDTGYTERYWVSASTGLLVHGETLDINGNVIYSITSKEMDISPQGDDIFKLPDGTFPE